MSCLRVRPKRSHILRTLSSQESLHSPLFTAKAASPISPLRRELVCGCKNKYLEGSLTPG